MISTLTRRWQTWLAAIMIGAILCVAILAPSIAPPGNVFVRGQLKVVASGQGVRPNPPSQEALLGTIYSQEYHYDVFYTLVRGTRQALQFGLGVTLITTLLGALIGAVCAFQGGLLNSFFLRITNAILAFPLMAAIPLIGLFYSLIMAKVFSASAATQYIINSQEELQTAVGGLSAVARFIVSLVMRVGPFTLSILLLSWVPYARLINDQILRLKNSEYILAARSLGARKNRIIFRHLIPNSLTPVVVWATKSVGSLVVLQATFTYIGLGGGGSAWASFLDMGKYWIIGPGGDLLTRWWVYLPITLAIVFFGFAWSLLGDEVNTWLNPRERY